MNHRFVIVFTKSHHWAVCWSTWIQSTTYKLSASPQWSVPFRFSYHIFIQISRLSHACCMTLPTRIPWFGYPNNFGENWKRRQSQKRWKFISHFHGWSPATTSFHSLAAILVSRFLTSSQFRTLCCLHTVILSCNLVTMRGCIQKFQDWIDN
jgi:hypothetical protein